MAGRTHGRTNDGCGCCLHHHIIIITFGASAFQCIHYCHSSQTTGKRFSPISFLHTIKQQSFMRRRDQLSDQSARQSSKTTTTTMMMMMESQQPRRRSLVVFVVLLFLASLMCPTTMAFRVPSCQPPPPPPQSTSTRQRLGVSAVPQIATRTRTWAVSSAVEQTTPPVSTPIQAHSPRRPAHFAAAGPIGPMSSRPLGGPML